MRHWTIQDSAVTELDGFTIDLLPPAAYAFVIPRMKATASGQQLVSLEAGPYVGSLPLSNGDVLYIVPRAGETAFARMLSVAEGLDTVARREFEDLTRLGYQEDAPTSWLGLVSRAYFRSLRTIEKSSLRNKRVVVRTRSAGAKGRVLVAPTRLSVLRNEVLPVHSVYRRRQLSTPENRVLASAASTLLGAKEVSGADLEVARRWQRRFGAPRAGQAELEAVIGGLSSQRYTGPRAYYIPALVAARLILAQVGMRLGVAASVDSEAFLTNMPTLFERYVRTVVANELHASGYTVRKLDSGAMPLYVDGSYELKPDAVIANAAGAQLLLDAKYKPDSPVAAGDHYQMLAYLSGYSTDRGIIIQATTSSESRPIVMRSTAAGLTVAELLVSLSDWRKAELMIIDGVRKMLGR